MVAHMKRSQRAFRPHDPRAALLRLFVAFAAGGITFVALSPIASVAVRALAAWVAFAGVLLAISWTIIARSDEAETRRRAASLDPGRGAAWAIVVVGSVFSLFAGVVVVRQSALLAPDAGAVLVALSLATVVLSWALTHTAYALRYAHLYYRRGGEKDTGGLEFPGDRAPSDFDFAYFAFVVGMCFQVSDVTVSSPTIRRAVLLHSIVAFVYNTAILAFVLNLAFGAVGR